MGKKYPELTHSQFPEQYDRLRVIRDPSANEIHLINQYNGLIASGQTAAAVELLNVNPKLIECILNADKLLEMQHAIFATQRFFYDSVLEKIYRMGQQRGDWNTLMSSTAEEPNRLNMYDIVRYPIDGIKQYFMVISSEIVAGTLPTNDKFYMQLTIKGDKGDRGDDGYTPIKGVDYFDGEAGLGLSPRGAWVNHIQYSQYDMVSHNGFLWYALAENTATEPTDDSPIWYKIEISLQVIVDENIPSTLEETGLWCHLQEDGHIILKTRNNTGQFDTLYPETKAKYITDETGTSLQQKIYQHYFERTDVKVRLEDKDPVYTSTATLISNPNIIVAKAILTDTSSANGKWTEEFTTYDDTGVIVTFKCKTVITEFDDGTWEKVTEIIV